MVIGRKVLNAIYGSSPKNVGFQATTITTSAIEMKAKADGPLTGAKCEHATATYFSMQQFG
ncbi:hypothetical protein AA0522_0898 [Gluconacetobacter liquefaciens NRIC 0522]|nr:hypothetical protein AA0522_0898 [Gluconacetobacter liquefaciens NRIC 0522]